MMDWPAMLAEHNRWLRTALFARLGHWQAVDEVMQEVSLAAVAVRSPLNDSERVGGWLYRVAVRQALLYRRRAGRQHKLVKGFAQSRGAESRALPDPLTVLLLEERRQLIRDALLTLARRDAEILLLKYTEGWTGRELALHMGLSERCVEARLHRARQRLRAALFTSQAIEVRK